MNTGKIAYIAMRTVSLCLLSVILVFPGFFIACNGSSDNAVNSNNSLLQFTSAGHVLGFDDNSVYIVGLDHALRVEFSGGNPIRPVVENNGTKQNGILELGTIRYKGIWKNIEIIYSAVDGGMAESTYVIHPGGDSADINLKYNVPVEIKSDGGLRFSYDNGYMTESAPVAWQDIKGERVAVNVNFAIRSDNRVGFSLGSYDTDYAVYIDPEYKWHTFFGSSDIDYGYDIALDSSGNIYIAGCSSVSWSDPSEPLHAYTGGSDIVIVKLDSSGAYQWHTFYGSSLNDEGRDISLDSSGNIYITGWSRALWSDPSEPLHTHTGNSDIVILKLDSAGTYQWHTFYGSTGNDYGYGTALNTSGNVYITGYSYVSWSDPSEPLHTHTGNNDIVILKLDSTGTYQWHTFYGSTGNDCGYAITLDSSGNICVTGNSLEPWSNPSEPLHAHTDGSNDDIVILKLDSTGTYQWHTFYGSVNMDMSKSIEVDSSGYVYVAGDSMESWNDPSTALHAHRAGINFDIVIIKLDSTGGYQWHTFYGSTSTDIGNGITLDSSGNIYVTGYSSSWSTPSAPLHAYTGNSDIVIMKLDSAGGYQWHTFYGSTILDISRGIEVDSSENIYVAGHSLASFSDPASPLHDHTGGNKNDITVLKMGIAYPSVTTVEATDIDIDSAMLNMSYTLGDYDTVDVRFGYKKSADLTWTYTTWVSKTTAGIYDEALTGLDRSTQYDFRAEIKYDLIEKQGNTLQFITEKINPTVITSKATGIGTDSAILNMSYTPGDYSAVDVHFGYKKSADLAWTYTSWISKTVAGSYSKAITGLDSGTQYSFRAELKYDNTEIQGSTLQFTTGQIMTTTTKKPFLDDSSSVSVGSPAHIGVKSVNVSQYKTVVNQSVILYANVVNDGDRAGVFTANLAINGEIEQTREVTVEGNVAVPVQFIVAKEKPGTYTVDINGKQTIFTVTDNAKKGSDISHAGIIYIAIFFIAVLFIILAALVIKRRMAEC